MRAVHAAPDTLWAILTGQARGPSLQPGDELVLEGAEFDIPVKLRVPGLSLRSAEPRAPATLKQSLSLSGDGTRASNVRVVGSTERSAVTISGRNCVLSQFEVTGHQHQGVEVTGSARNPLVELGWIHGQVPGAEAGTPRANLIFGSDKQTSDEEIGGVARYILIETASSNRNAAEIKATSVRYENIVAPGGRVYTRHGLRNRLVSCMAPLLLANEDAALVGCVADGADGLVGIKAGGITGDELRHGQGATRSAPTPCWSPARGCTWWVLRKATVRHGAGRPGAPGSTGRRAGWRPDWAPPTPRWPSCRTASPCRHGRWSASRAPWWA